MSEKELHTAEHIFARALQNLGIDLHVLKVDTESGPIGTAIFKEKVELSALANAEHEVNRVISKGLDVSIETFSNLEEAKAKYPKLRLYEERLQGKESYRLVKIGDYDFAMCKHEHVSNTAQIKAFSLKQISYPEGQTKIEFLAGEDAMEYLLDMNERAIEQSIMHNFEPGEIAAKYSQTEERQRKLEKELEELFDAMFSEGQRIFYSKELNVSRLYKFAKKQIDKNEESYVILLNSAQIACMSGSSCDLDLIGLGNTLKELGLLEGAIKEHSINGRISDSKKAYEAIKGFISSSKH